MPISIISDFFNIINIPLFDKMSVILIISFIVWEIPRSIKILADEYTKDLYPPTGRVMDIFLFFVGLASIIYFMIDNNAEKIVSFLKIPGVTSFVLILMLAVPLIIIVGYVKRFFGRMDKNNSITLFLTHAFLDLMHTLFHISLVALFVPAIGYLLFGAR